MSYYLSNARIAMLLLMLLCGATLAEEPIDLVEPKILTGPLSKDSDIPAEDLARAMQGMFLAVQGNHLQASEIFADLGEHARSPELMGEAYEESLRGNAPLARVLNHAVLWREFGGGEAALRAHARVLLMQQQWDEARVVLNQLTIENSDDELLYETLKHAGDKRAELAQEFLSDKAEGSYYLARTALELSNWMLSEEAINRGIASGEKLADFQMLKMQLLASQTRTWLPLVESVGDYVQSECAGFAGVCTEAMILHAYVTFSQRGDWQEEALPEDAALSAARVMEAAGETARAREYYSQSRGFDAKMGMARLARQDDDLEEALKILNNTAVANGREFSRREVLAGNILKEWQGAAVALPRVQQAQKTLPDDAGLLFLESTLREETGDVDGAIILLRQMVALFPKNGESWNALGYVLADNNRNLDQAEEYIHKALAFSPDNASYLDSLGWVYFRQGRLQEALEYLIRASQKLHDVVILTHLGEVYWVLGEQEKARTALQDAHALDPDNKILLDTLERLSIELP